MSVTIQEVAEAAGVSKATVSKVLHKSYSISQETCDRVNTVIKELGYQPNRRAQSFATGATKTILFLTEMQHGVGFDNPHLFEIMAGVENALSEKGYGLIVQHSTALDLWQHFDELLQGSYVDGVILHASVVSKDVALCLAHTELPYMHGTCIRMRNKRNLFTCQSAVNYRLNLCKANKVKKRAVLALTLHKECDIVVLHRINRYSSA